jgi:hypothetical protein
MQKVTIEAQIKTVALEKYSSKMMKLRIRARTNMLPIIIGVSLVLYFGMLTLKLIVLTN